MLWLRVVAAAGFSVLLPGAGHAYLRDWMRALIFIAIYVPIVYLFVPTGELLEAATLVGSGSIIDGVGAASSAFTDGTDLVGQFTILFVIMYATSNAVFQAVGYGPGGQSTAGGTGCPVCGRELDTDLDFCHWCTTPLETAPEADNS